MTHRKDYIYAKNQVLVVHINISFQLIDRLPAASWAYGLIDSIHKRLHVAAKLDRCEGG